MRQAFVLDGFEAALARKTPATSPTPKRLGGAGEARLIALRLGPPPTGFGQWTLRPLADQLVEVEVVDSISPETVRQTVKKGMTKRKITYWVIPPQAGGEFVAHLEEGLDTDEKAYDPARPVVCMDEQPVQLIGETRVPIPASKGHPKRVDYEYERKGTASTFLFAEPLPGFRQATARPRRTKDDWAREVAHLLDTRCAGVERITLVCDNPNTHTEGAFYEAFPTDRRIGDLATLRSEIAAWSARVNDKQRAVGWRFTIDEARVKLKRLYPKR